MSEVLKPLIGIAASRTDEVRSQAVAVGEQRLQKMFGQKLRMAAGERCRLRALDRRAGALGIAFKVHE